ncbi:MAG: carbon monoxide dehydrogenase, partial [Desulfobacterales bacterium]|nr:carbon monoxide dehydrogenase [Desulfobacterales bacterium]MDX2513332.1 carbon monoxide dehydrogenase [Desulfobacterales bacterium]
MEKKKVTPPKKEMNISDVTICEATAQMLRKAKRDGVETAFDRALNMKACPIGAESACCKHCSIGPCRLKSKNPYGKEALCRATNAP